MADGESRVAQQQTAATEAERLRYLGFVQAATLRAILCFTNIYGFAKDKSGPLKPSVESLEGTVKNVVGPVYVKYQDVPIEFLKFMDRKMEESVTKLDTRVPPQVKRVSEQAVSVAKRAPETARTVATEVQRAGLTNTAKNLYSMYEPTAKEAYAKYEPVAEKYAVSAWQKLNRVPLFPQVAQMVLPTAAYCSEKYNETVMNTAEKGYRVASYLPLVPTERISKVFGADHHQGMKTQVLVAGSD